MLNVSKLFEKIDFASEWADNPIGYDAYMTRGSIAIAHFHKLLDTAIEEIISQYPDVYREGMTKRELAYEIIKRSHA
jgi:hypothetical protein